MKRIVRILGIAMVLCMLFSVISFASTGKQNEKITYRSISIVVNGSEIAPCDVKGNSTEPFIRNADGSTYLPVRATEKLRQVQTSL